MSSLSNEDGTFTVIYAIEASNLGDTDLTSLQITDPLERWIAAPSGFEVISLESDGLEVRDDYDGRSVAEMLVGGASLAPGDVAGVTVSVRITPGSQGLVVGNSASATALDPDGIIVSDTSQDGAEPDPDGDGDPTNNDEPTEIALAPSSLIGLSKEVASISGGKGEPYLVTWVLRVRNYGTTPLERVQARESLTLAFPAPAEVQVTDVASNEFEVNYDYDGDSDIYLLTGSDSLNAGEQGSITVTLEVLPNGAGAWFRSRAFGSGVGPEGEIAMDLSTDGVDPDPDSDGDPTNDSGYSQVFLAQSSTGGLFETTIAIETDPISINLDLFGFEFIYTIEDFVARLTGRFTNSSFDLLTAGVSGTLGEIPLASIVTFNPSTISFVSWQSSASYDLYGVLLTDVFYVTAPQTASYNLLKISGNVGAVAIETQAKFGICPLLFWEANTCADWDWSFCSTHITACLSINDAVGFESFTISAVDIDLFDNLFGIRGALDVLLEYSLEGKTVTPSLRFEPNWLFCPGFTVIGEVSKSDLSVTGVSIYGLRAECTIGKMTVKVAESLADEKNAAITGKADYFELIAIEGPLYDCCGGSSGGISLYSYFERSPAPSGAMFGFGLLDAEFRLQLGENFSTTFATEFRPVAPIWQLSVTFRVIW